MAHRTSSAALNELLIDSGIALAIMAVISIWLGWVVAGRALRPLRTITSTAREISASSLHRRLALTGPDDELKQLGNTFDALLGRLETAFEAQRRFVANASHELRTPLTLERTLVEVALADPHPTVESLRRTCEQVLAAGEHQERLIEALLTLSRSQRGLDRHDRVDLTALTGEALDAVEAGALTLTTALEPASTDGDRRLVERLITNLLVNGVRHNVPHGWIDVRTATVSGRAILAVANSGAPIPADQLDRLVQPFQRLDRERHSGEDGLGLGLSIVQAIAEAHGATLTLDPLADGGLRVEVSFPASRVGPGEPSGGAEPPSTEAEPRARLDPVRR
jgi:signal transduction histidine kinase